jgi:hypothetical protein
LVYDIWNRKLEVENFFVDKFKDILRIDSLYYRISYNATEDNLFKRLPFQRMRIGL